MLRACSRHVLEFRAASAFAWCIEGMSSNTTSATHAAWQRSTPSQNLSNSQSREILSEKPRMVVCECILKHCIDLLNAPECVVVKNQNLILKVISRLRRAIMFLIADSESTHKVTSICRILVWMSIFMESWAPIPDFGKNFVLLFANSGIGSGPNRPRIRIRHGFFIFEVHYLRQSRHKNFSRSNKQSRFFSISQDCGEIRPF